MLYFWPVLLSHASKWAFSEIRVGKPDEYTMQLIWLSNRLSLIALKTGNRIFCLKLAIVVVSFLRLKSIYTTCEAGTFRKSIYWFASAKDFGCFRFTTNTRFSAPPSAKAGRQSEIKKQKKIIGDPKNLLMIWVFIWLNIGRFSGWGVVTEHALF